MDATGCQASVSVIPRLRDGGTRVSFESSGRSVTSAGPALEQARTCRVAGDFETPDVTLEVAPPRGAQAVAVCGAAHALSYTQPNPRIRYQIEASTDGGRSWKPVVKDWQVVRLGEGPKSGWSQSFVWGSAEVDAAPVRVRFDNDGKIAFKRAEAHLVYRTGQKDSTKVTFEWTDEGGAHRESHVFGPGQPAEWVLPTGKGVVTRWVEMEAVSGPE